MRDTLSMVGDKEIDPHHGKDTKERERYTTCIHGPNIYVRKKKKKYGGIKRKDKWREKNEEK